MPTVLVTGAAGFIGSHSVERLLAQGQTVLGVDNFRTGRAENLSAVATHPNFRLIRGDLLEQGFIPRLMAAEKPGAVLHLAALVSVPESIAQPDLNRRLNFEVTRDLARAAAREGTHRFVFASSAAVYGANPRLPLTEGEPGAPLSPYGEAKLAGERLLADLTAAHPGFTASALRYFNVYGPRQDPGSPYSGVISLFAAALRAGQTPTIFGDGWQTRDFVAVADVAHANCLALAAPLHGMSVINVCRGRADSLRSLLREMNALLECEIAPHFAPARAGDIIHSLGSPDRAAALLGFCADLDLRAGLRPLLSPRRQPSPDPYPSARPDRQRADG